MMEHQQGFYGCRPASADVTLTRFSSLDKVDHKQVTQMQDRKSMGDQLANFDHFEKNDNSKKWLWSRGNSNNDIQKRTNDEETPIGRTRQVVLDPVLLKEVADFEASRSPKEPFRVIWSKLAFEVDTITYNKLLERALNRLTSMFSCSDETHSSKVSAPPPQPDKRVIFENMNGHINSGEISAILGPSGAGKTSLINAICSKANSNYRGQVHLIGSSSSRMRVSVIPQKDHLLDRLTVEENLLFASKLLNPDRGFDHEANILRLAKMLHLENCLKSSTSSLSGGEHKRVSIAQELLKRPDILILDEPTSGLDSVNCKNLIKSLRALIDASNRGAINPIAIVLTIHQPDVEIFHMFDHIYCMARGGRTIYEGHPSKALEVIRSQWGRGACEQAVQFANVNPANLLIEIASEFVYGPEPIEKLNKYQLKQFENQNQVSPQYKRADTKTNPLGSSWPNMTNHLVGGGGSNADVQKSASSSKSNLSLEMPTTVQAHLSTSPMASSFSFHSLTASELSSSLSSSSSSFSSPSQKSNELINRTMGKKNFVRDKRLTSKVDHSGQFWRQMCLLTKRNLIADLRDPLMTGAAIVFHLVIPIVMWVAYSKRIGTANACPIVHREMEMLAMVSSETATKLAQMEEEFVVALECSTMFFLTSYCFSLRSLSMAALSFPLSMHVLVKETRNGWYEVPAYVLAKTISSFLTEVLLPVVSVIMIYVILDMPHSPYEWRLWAVALVMALVSLISTVQGLIWGALSMDSVQTAIFMGSASSLPLVMLSGFTARIGQMPLFMQYLSWTSLYRYSSDAINIIRFGYGLCPCDAAMDEYLKTKPASFVDLPDRMKPLFTFYLTNYASSVEEKATTVATSELVNATLSSGNGSQLLVAAAQQQIAGISYDLVLNLNARNDLVKRLEANELDLFAKMAELLAKTFTYGREITGCDSVQSQLLYKGGFPKDHYLVYLVGGLAIMFALFNILLFAVVKSKVSKRI